MTLFLDTSALVKRYRDEDGTQEVLAAMAEDLGWVVSAVARTEASLALSVAVEATDRAILARHLAEDLDRCLIVPLDPECLERATEIGCAHQVRTLDAIHLAAADRLPRPFRFATFDRRQAEAAEALGFSVLGGATAS
jgi:predicted nucleic acid-binding protein